MDFIQAILDFFSVTSYKSDNSKKDKAVLFFNDFYFFIYCSFIFRKLNL